MLYLVKCKVMKWNLEVFQFRYLQLYILVKETFKVKISNLSSTTIKLYIILEYLYTFKYTQSVCLNKLKLWSISI